MIVYFTYVPMIKIPINVEDSAILSGINEAK